MSIFDASSGLDLDQIKSRTIDKVYSEVSVGGCHSQAEPGQVNAHYLDIHLSRVFVKGGTFCAGCIRTGGNANSPPVGARPAANVQHDNGIL
jgi:hypothetical protein